MVAIKIEKSPIPIVWLDTSVITNMTMYRTNPRQLDKTQQVRIGHLYELIRAACRRGKVICPLGGQEFEVWKGRDEWLDTIYDLGLGMQFAPEKTIQENQMRSAISAYLRGDSELKLSYLDAFVDDPITDLKELLNQPVFLAIKRDIMFGAEYHRKKNPETLALLNEGREKNVRERVSLDQQLETERLGELRLLLSECAKLLSSIDESEDGNPFWCYIELVNRVRDWINLGGSPPDISGYIKFYKSEYNLKSPKNHLNTLLFAKIMVDKQPIRSGDPMDIRHISTLMPYSNLFITDRAWSAFLNQKKIADSYGTTVCYIGDTEVISRFLEPLVA